MTDEKVCCREVHPHPVHTEADFAALTAEVEDMHQMYAKSVARATRWKSAAKLWRPQSPAGERRRAGLQCGPDHEHLYWLTRRAYHQERLERRAAMAEVERLKGLAEELVTLTADRAAETVLARTEAEELRERVATLESAAAEVAMASALSILNVLGEMVGPTRGFNECLNVLSERLDGERHTGERLVFNGTAWIEREELVEHTERYRSGLMRILELGSIGAGSRDLEIVAAEALARKP